MDYEIDHLSAITRQILEGAETIDVEFKESPIGIKSDDLVAFCNSPLGGTILVGIGEATTEDGRQRGEIIGCDVSDKARLTIFNRAESCIPPVHLTLWIENTADKPVMRIHIPSGKDKPYCTGGGTYKIRGNGRTNTLDPTKLLALFIDSEGERFLKQFKDATEGLDKQINRIEELTAELNKAATNEFSWLDKRLREIESKLAKLLGG